MSDYCIVLTTFDKRDECESIINQLVELKLAACVQIFNIDSFYRWEGKLANEKEIVALIKTKYSLYKEIEIFIKENHSYTTPEIIVIPLIDGSMEYFNWIDSVCK